MQCKEQGYMMLKDTTSKTKRYQLKIPIVKLNGTTCKHFFETYLALTNVPMWYYGFKPCFLQILPIT